MTHEIIWRLKAKQVAEAEKLAQANRAAEHTKKNSDAVNELLKFAEKLCRDIEKAQPNPKSGEQQLAEADQDKVDDAAKAVRKLMASHQEKVESLQESLENAMERKGQSLVKLGCEKLKHEDLRKTLEKTVKEIADKQQQLKSLNENQIPALRKSGDTAREADAKAAAKELEDEIAGLQKKTFSERWQAFEKHSTTSYAGALGEEQKAAGDEKDLRDAIARVEAELKDMHDNFTDYALREFHRLPEPERTAAAKK